LGSTEFNAPAPKADFKHLLRLVAGAWAQLLADERVDDELLQLVDV
jgi:hypothetical protein